MADTLQTFTGTEYFFAHRTPVFFEQPLGEVTTAGFGGGRAVVGSNVDQTLTVLDATGRLRRHLSIELQRRPAEIRDLLAAITTRIAEEPDSATRGLLRRAIVEAPIRESLPFYAGFVFDALGNVWVKTYTGFADHDRWLVLDTTGAVAARVDLPVNFAPHRDRTELCGRI